MINKVDKFKFKEVEIKEDILHTRNIRIVTKIDKSTNIRTYTVKHKVWFGWSSNFKELGECKTTDFDKVRDFIKKVDIYDTKKGK